MKFYEVLKSVMRGNKAYRKGWNGKNMFIYLERGSVIPKSKVNNDTLRFSLSDKEVTINPHIDLKNSKGELQVGWSPSQEDLLADDWQDFYFQDKDMPINTITIQGKFVFPGSIEEMSNKIKDTLQDIFEESDIMEASRNDLGMPLNEALVVTMNNWDMGYLTYTLVTLSKDSPLENSNNAGVISIEDIIEYIYKNVSNIGTPYKFRDFQNNPERVIYEIVKDKVNNF